MSRFEVAVRDLLNLQEDRDRHVKEMGLYTYTKQVLMKAREVSSMALQCAEDIVPDHPRLDE